MTGKIHSIESFGTVDGPGTRLVVFFQGCPMRCQYCHNPDTWPVKGGKEISVEEIIEKFEHNRPFYRNGGITATGGEAMLQIDFLTELFKEAKARNIHTCLDTSGITFNKDNAYYLDKVNELIKYVDLVMLDIKHIDDEKHFKLTGHHNSGILAFAKYLSDHGKTLWIRHVVVPGITDDPEYLYKLGEFLGSLKTLQALDVLPYHVMGVSKYELLGIVYPLKDLDPLTKEEAIIAKQEILRGIKASRGVS